MLDHYKVYIRLARFSPCSRKHGPFLSQCFYVLNILSNFLNNYNIPKEFLIHKNFTFFCLFYPNMCSCTEGVSLLICFPMTKTAPRLCLFSTVFRKARALKFLQMPDHRRYHHLLQLHTGIYLPEQCHGLFGTIWMQRILAKTK